MDMKKTGDQRRQERLRHYRREYAGLKARLREIGFLCEGTLVERWMQCGKPNCACASDRARLHGPYFQLSWTDKVNPGRAPTGRARCSIVNGSLTAQRLQSIVEQMHGVSQKARRHLLPTEKPKKAVPKPGDIPRSPR